MSSVDGWKLKACAWESIGKFILLDVWFGLLHVLGIL